MSGRITVRLDQGLGWTAPVFVAGCRTCGIELARSTDRAVAERTARWTRCPACGTRTGRRLPGTTSLTTDLALAGAREGAPVAAAGPLPADPPPAPDAREGGEIPYACLPGLADRQPGRHPPARVTQDGCPLGE